MTEKKWHIIILVVFIILFGVSAGCSKPPAKPPVEKSPAVEVSPKVTPTPKATKAATPKPVVSSTPEKQIDQAEFDELLNSIKKSDLEAVKKILDKSPELANAKNFENGRTPLYEALSLNDGMKLAGLLISNGADVNAGDDYGLTPLHLMVLMGKKEKVVYLISKGANVNTSNNDNETPLHGAAGRGLKDIAGILVEKGAELNVRDREWKYTPLDIARRMDQKEMVAFLLSKGAKGPREKTDVPGRDALKTFEGHSGAITNLVFSRDGKFLVSAAEDRTIKVWDVTSGKIEKDLGEQCKEGKGNKILALSFKWESELLAVVNRVGEQVVLSWKQKGWSANEPAVLAKIREQDSATDNPNDIAVFNPDGTMLVVGRGHYESGAKMKYIGKNLILSTDNWKPLRTFEIQTVTDQQRIGFSKDGKKLFMAGAVTAPNGSPEGKLLPEIDVQLILVSNWESNVEAKVWAIPTCMALSLRGDKLILGTAKVIHGNLFHLDLRGIVKAPQPYKKSQLLNDEIKVSFLVSQFSTNGYTLAAGCSDGTIRIWKVASWKHVMTLKGHDKKVVALAFSPEGDLLASGSEDNTIKLWSLKEDDSGGKK